MKLMMKTKKMTVDIIIITIILIILIIKNSKNNQDLTQNVLQLTEVKKFPLMIQKDLKFVKQNIKVIIIPVEIVQ